MRHLLFPLAVAGLTGGQPASAQSVDEPNAPITWEAWGALAQNSPGTLWGAERGRDIAVLALRAAKPFGAPSVRLEYVIDVVPAAWVSMPLAPSRCGPLPSGEPCTDYHAFEGSRVAWGAGIAPIGLQAEFLPGRRALPYISASTGLLYFSRPMPVEGAGRLNFTADAGAGVRIALSTRLQGAVGYKFYHISNGGTARRNPGLDGHMIVIGLRHLR